MDNIWEMFLNWDLLVSGKHIYINFGTLRLKKNHYMVPWVTSAKRARSDTEIQSTLPFTIIIIHLGKVPHHSSKKALYNKRVQLCFPMRDSRSKYFRENDFFTNLSSLPDAFQCDSWFLRAASMISYYFISQEMLAWVKVYL